MSSGALHTADGNAYVIESQGARGVEGEQENLNLDRRRQKSFWSRAIPACVLFLTAAIFFVVGIFVERAISSSASETPSVSSSSTAASSEAGDLTAPASALPAATNGTVLVDDETLASSPEKICLEEAETVSTVTFDNLPDTLPNVLVFLVDDLGYADISATGAEYSTPHFDEIFDDGVKLASLYGMPLCTPTRSSLMTGRFTWKMGLQYFEVLHWDMTTSIPVDSDTYTLGDYFSSVGYSTAYYGRWALGHANTDFLPTRRGYDEFVGFMALLTFSSFEVEAGTITVEDENGAHSEIHVMDFFVNETFVYPNEIWPSDLTYNDDYIEYMLENRLRSLTPNPGDETPWHFFWAPQGVHDSAEYEFPPKLYPECSKTRRNYYCNKVKYLDEQFGHVTSLIKERGEWDNTLIFLLSDNGGAQAYVKNEDHSLMSGDGEWLASNYPYRGCKGTFYEGGVKLLAGMGGGWLPEEYRGTVMNDRLHMVDIAATLADIIGVTDPRRAKMDGKDFLKGENHNEQLVLSIAPMADVPWLDDDDPIGVIPMGMGTCVYYGDWKYLVVSLYGQHTLSGGGYENPDDIKYLTGLMNITHTNGSISIWDDDDFKCWGLGDNPENQGCLFNIKEDPREKVNLWDVRQDIVKEIKEVLWDEFFGYDYHPGQNMNLDVRAAAANLGDIKEYGDSPMIWVYPWMQGDFSMPLKWGNMTITSF